MSDKELLSSNDVSYLEWRPHQDAPKNAPWTLVLVTPDHTIQLLHSPGRIPLRGAAPEPPVAPQRMRIAFQPQGRCLWHEDCAKASSGVMREVEHEESRSLLECLNCGQRGYYPKGAVGSVCVDVVGCSTQPPGAKGDDNTNTAADRPSAITAGEAAASDGDFACPVVSPSSREQIALRAIYDATAEDGLHENKALFDVAREGLGYSTSTKPAARPPFGECTAVVSDGTDLCHEQAEPGTHRCKRHSLGERDE